MITVKSSLLFFAIMGIFVNNHSQTLPVVDSVDLKKYSGTWFEISSFPQRFQKGCTCTTAKYTLTDKGYVIVENNCFKPESGKNASIKGKAFTEKDGNNAKLKVQFFWPFKAKYWIIDLASDYSYAVVGHPNREYLWILSRTPVMDEITYNQITARAAANGFDISKLKTTIQNCD